MNMKWGQRAAALVLVFGATTVMAAPTGLSLQGQKAAAPDVAINARGELAVLWVDRSPQEKAGANHDRHLALTDVYVAISRDGGNTFAAPVKLNAAEGAVWGQQVSRPRVVGTPNGTWHVSYAANDTHPTLGKTILSTHYTRSLDGGRSFEAPRRLSSVPDQDLSSVIHGGFASAAAFGTLASAPDGSVHVYWIDTRHMKPDSDSGAMYGVVSRDDGRSFAAEQQFIDTGVCPCCQMMAVANAKSELLVGSRRVMKDSFRPATVMHLTAKSSAAPQRAEIGGAPWQIAGCPLKPTVLAVQGDRVFAAVHNGGETTPGVIFSISKDGGATFAFKGLVHAEAAVSDAPAVATNGSTVLLAWHAKVGSGARRVYYRLFDLDGQPQSDIRELDTTPGTAQSPVVTARPDGNFQLVWQQADTVWTTVVAAR